MNGTAHDKPGGSPEPLLGDLIIPALAVALLVYYIVSTTDLTWEAKATGTLVGIVLGTLCGLQLLRVAQRMIIQRGGLGFGDLLADTPHNRTRLGLIVLTAAFIGTVGWLGTTLGLFLLLIGLMLVMGVRAWRTLLAIALCTSATVYILLIRLLGTKLPHGVFEKTMAGLIGGGG